MGCPGRHPDHVTGLKVMRFGTESEFAFSADDLHERRTRRGMLGELRLFPKSERDEA